jgi:hypothetical protein
MMYELDFKRANELWPGGPQLETIEDLYSVTVDVDGSPRKYATHLFDKPVHLIPYEDPDSPLEDAERGVPHGAAAIAEYFPPGAVGFAIKNRRTQYRLLRIRANDATKLIGQCHLPLKYTRHVKLQDMHVAAVIGVEGGVVPIGSPTRYPNRTFYRRNYPMIFVRPVFPEFIAPPLRDRYLDNIRTMLVCFALISRDTPDYNEQNLPATTPQSIAQWTEMMIRALAGEPVGRAFFRKEENRLYCGEFVYIATSAGIASPLNATTWKPVVGEATWSAFLSAVDAHNSTGSRALARRRGRNGLQLLKVPLKLAPDDLAPIDDLAFRPMPLFDIIEAFIRAYWPRSTEGQEVGRLQANVVQALRPAFKLLSGRNVAPFAAAEDAAYETLVSDVLATVGASYASDAAFRSALDGVRGRVGEFLTAHGRQHLAVPPLLFHLIAQGHYQSGALGLEYVGHGIHRSLVSVRSSP